MKNWAILAIGLLLCVSVASVTAYIKERNRTTPPPPAQPPQQIVVNIPDVPTPDNNRPNGFNYRGLILNIETHPGNGTDITLGPGNLYNMGYHDGRYRYPINPRYANNYHYMRGYRVAYEYYWPHVRQPAPHVNDRFHNPGGGR